MDGLLKTARAQLQEQREAMSIADAATVARTDTTPTELPATSTTDVGAATDAAMRSSLACSLVSRSPLVLLMCRTPAVPRCEASLKAVKMLRGVRAPFDHFDV